MMPPKQKNQKQGETVADKLLGKYKQYIAKEIYDNHGLGPRGKDNWIESFPYSTSMESFIIKNTKLWIRLLDSRDSNSSNPQFLKALVNRIVVYLADWAENAPNRTKNSAIKALKRELWDNNSYIQGMLLWQQQQRNTHRSPQTVAAKHKRERIANAKRNYDMHRQVSLVFIEVNQYKIKK